VARHCQAHLRRTREEGSHAHEEGPDCFPEEARPRTQVSEEPREGRVQGEEGHVQALQEVNTLLMNSLPCTRSTPEQLPSLSFLCHYEGSEHIAICVI